MHIRIWRLSIRWGVALALAILQIPAPASEAVPKLYSDETNVQSDDGRLLKLRLEEVERAPQYSLIKVTHSSGASVPSIMFVVHGMWAIAHLRDKAFFVKLKEWTDENEHWMYKVGFASTKNVDALSCFGQELPKKSRILAVRDYDIIFDDRIGEPR